MGGIHCMFTSANKPCASVCFGTSHCVSLSVAHCWLRRQQLHASKRHDKVQKTLLNERTFLAGFFVLF